MSIASKIFVILLGSLAIFSGYSVVTMFLERAPKPWYVHIGSYLFLAFLFAVCVLTAIACFLLLFTKAWENYTKNCDYDYDYVEEGETKNPLPVKIEVQKIVESDALLDDKSINIPCEVFWLNQWYQAQIIRELKLRTGIGKQFCRVYLVEIGEIGAQPVRQWLSADLIRQPSGERWEPEEYH
ncbi:MAG: hypothetical protein ACM37W_19880 [Actinomycetota bacterium]